MNPSFALVTGDLSFISETLVLPALVPLMKPGAALLMLVKPQFELQPGQIGKGGIVNHVMGAVDPQGVHLAAFKKPTPEELEHDFLWRVHREVPAAGQIGVFDRSHYEDVLIGRVRELAPPEEIERRYDATSTVFCTQYAKKDWHQRLGSDVHADAIMDRIVHNTIWITTGEMNMREQAATATR